MSAHGFMNLLTSWGKEIKREFVFFLLRYSVLFHFIVTI